VLKIVKRGDKFVIRRDQTADFAGPAAKVSKYWTGSRWSNDIGEAKAFATESDAEECRVVG